MLRKIGTHRKVDYAFIVGLLFFLVLLFFEIKRVKDTRSLETKSYWTLPH